MRKERSILERSLKTAGANRSHLLAQEKKTEDRFSTGKTLIQGFPSSSSQTVLTNHSSCNVMGTKRLPYPGGVFDLVRLLLMRYKGIDRSLALFCKIDAAMSALMKKMCWELVVIKNDTVNQGSQWPEQWSARAKKVPYWLKSSQVGVYGKASPEDFAADYEHWKHVVSKSYLNRMGISWSKVRNVMDMRSVYGGWRWSTVRLNVQKFHLGGTPRKVLYNNESRLCPS
ncbi:hypothetical protein IFM89_007906 [Coptis chinensis]|uniref:Methyltransferase n=1 Tax=Coptis chinensis TaxID=261450 RepID=A0A835HD18_9MAGN|nr:hypothetical protein IFM89_007906 [Coptis chinensis]